MSEFETRKISELKFSSTRPYNDNLNEEFAKLGTGFALFVPKGDCASIGIRRTSTYRKFRAKFPDRQIFTTADKEKDGVWFWWTKKS